MSLFTPHLSTFPMDTETRYNQALDYLYSFVDYSLKKSSELAAANFDLSRMRDFLALLGDPQNASPAIHVAGTKGKGSTSALCASALQAAGYKTGLYTSPHLLDFCERIQINGQPIPHAALADLVDEIRPAVQKIARLTTFELTTALGFLYFARQGCSAAVIEVGLGGRLDATNLLTPRVSVITALSYDHTAVLGDTLEKIAAEKAGIIKTGIPVVSAPQSPQALSTLTAIAAQRRAPLTLIGRDLAFAPLQHSLRGQSFRLGPAAEFHIPLLGAHQIENAACAYAALKNSGLALSEEALRAGFAAVRWPCRFEIFQLENPPIILDSAHNEDSFRRLAQTLREYFPGRPVVLLLGISEDKHLAAMLAAMHGIITRLIVTRSLHPRALEPEKIIPQAEQAGLNCEALTPVEAAVARGLAVARQENAVLLSAGSMFVTAAVKEILLKGIL